MSSVTTIAMPNRYASFGSSSAQPATGTTPAMTGEMLPCPSAPTNTPSDPAKPAVATAITPKDMK